HDLATKNSFHGGQKRRFVSWPLRNPATLLTLSRPRITLLAVAQPFSSEMRFSMKPALLGMLGTFLGLDTDAWWFMPLLVLAAVALIFVFRHACLVRFPLWLLRHTFYRLYVQGAENVPSTGPVLFVSNHVSWIDAFLILAAQKRRVRFLIWAPFMGLPF